MTNHVAKFDPLYNDLTTKGQAFWGLFSEELQYILFDGAHDDDETTPSDFFASEEPVIHITEGMKNSALLHYCPLQDQNYFKIEDLISVLKVRLSEGYSIISAEDGYRSPAMRIGHGIWLDKNQQKMLGTILKLIVTWRDDELAKQAANDEDKLERQLKDLEEQASATRRRIKELRSRTAYR